MRVFYQLLINALIVVTKNNFVWFALTYWAYLETQSVIATSLVGGIYLVASTLSSFWFGSLVDRYKKKNTLIFSNIATLIFFILGYLLLKFSPQDAFSVVTSPYLLIFILLLLAGAIAGNILNIAIPTLITLLVETDKRDRANGLFGTVIGVAFAITSFASGIVLAFGGMEMVLGISIVLTIIAASHLVFVHVAEERPIKLYTKNTKNIDIAGTIKAIKSIPGLFALIFFTTFNNFIGGVFMALMDAYGLSLVSVQVWGMLWGVLSFGFIFGGIYIAQKGLGNNPLQMLFRINSILWIVCIFFTIQPSIILLSVGAFIWMSMIPFVEATEQTIIQKVVPPERQGRVFGFAHSIEQAASPLTAFFIGPVAQFVFIPFMTTGRGVELIGDWFGVGVGRGIALVFILAGILGLIVTLIAKRSYAYTLLSQRYLEKK